MNLQEIVSAYLIANGYDGVYNAGECACKVGDLFPCESPQGGCVAGYRVPCDCGEHDFHMREKKP